MRFSAINFNFYASQNNTCVFQHFRNHSMETHQFYGHHKMSSSSDDSDGEKSYEPSSEEMESSYESDASRISDSEDDTASLKEFTLNKESVCRDKKKNNLCCYK